MLPVTVPPKKLSSQSCLDVVEARPYAARYFNDYDVDGGTLKGFASNFFQQGQKQLAKRTGCRSEQTPSFKCVDFEGGSPVCVADKNDLFVIITKDRVDEARLLAVRKDLAAEKIIPSVDVQNNGSTLYLPETGACYRGLLGQNNDSRLFQVFLDRYLPSKDVRFLMAQSLREVVGDIAQSHSNSECAYIPIERSASAAQCFSLGNGQIQACNLVSGSNGHLTFIFQNTSDQSFMIFNRYD